MLIMGEIKWKSKFKSLDKWFVSLNIIVFKWKVMFWQRSTVFSYSDFVFVHRKKQIIAIAVIQLKC